VLAYLIAKAAGSFSAGVEAAGDGAGACAGAGVASGEGASPVVKLTVLDFASLAPPGSVQSERTLFTLLVAARDGFGVGCTLAPSATVTAAIPFPLAPAACSTAAVDQEQGTWMFCDIPPTLVARHAPAVGEGGNASLRIDDDGAGAGADSGGRLVAGAGAADPTATMCGSRPFFVLPMDEF
jgi:hypothetical protein